MTAPAPERVFLGYNRPALKPAAAWLISQRERSGEADLSNLFVCVAGGRAGRQLLALLVETCADRGLVLVPPEIGTAHDLLDALVPPRMLDGRRIAARADRLLAWCRTLSEAAPDLLGVLTPRRDLTNASGLISRLHIAGVLDDCRAELAGNGLTLGEAMAALERSASDIPDLDRWRVVAGLERAYTELLDAQHLADESTLRLGAVQSGKLRPGVEIVLVAAPELPPLVRQALALHPPRTVLMVADAAEADRFDPLGAVVPGAFARSTLRHDQIRVVDGPAGQAREATAFLAGLAPGIPSDDVLIGVPDSDVVPTLQMTLTRAGVRTRDASGRALDRTAPVRFLDAVASFQMTGHTRDMSSLVRHPDVFAWLTSNMPVAQQGAPRAWLRSLDGELGERLTTTLAPDWATNTAELPEVLAGTTAGLAELLGGLAPGATATDAVIAPLGHWLAEIRSALSRLYHRIPAGPEGEDSDTAFRACERLAAALEELEGACAAGPSPEVAAPEAIRLVLDLVRGDRLPERADPDSVELVGWLEIAFDDAVACVVTGMNEGKVPRRPPINPLLAGPARRALGLDALETTLGRDSYLLNVLLRCHERVLLIAGRRSLAGDPLLPSRLLFACDDAMLPARVRLWSEPPAPAPTTGPSAPARTDSLFRPLPRVDTPPVTSMPVTSFRTYLNSPYAFLLRYVLGLEDVEAPGPELEPGGVGSLLHSALKRFADGPARDASDEPTIRAALGASLDAAVRESFGPSPPAVVLAQVVQLRERLAGIAEFQTIRRAQGWTILHTEWSPKGPASIEAPGGPMTLRGKIDRIDRQNSTGALAILDYKTSESLQGPNATHRRGSDWTDLQLPLYRHLAAELWRNSPTPIDLTLAYVCIPVKPGPAELLLAPWSAQELENADEAARAIIARVRAGEFFEAGDLPPDSGVLGLLCGQGLISPSRAPEAGEIADAGDDA